MKMRESLLHGTLPVPGLLSSLPHHSGSSPYLSGAMRSSASQWPVQDLLLVRLVLLATQAWSLHRWTRSLMSSKTSSTLGSNYSSPRMRLVRRIMPRSQFQQHSDSWRPSWLVVVDSSLWGTTSPGLTSTPSCISVISLTKVSSKASPSLQTWLRESEIFQTSRTGWRPDLSPPCKLQYQPHTFITFTIKHSVQQKKKKKKKKK